jgi:hypothetical protein
MALLKLCVLPELVPEQKLLQAQECRVCRQLIGVPLEGGGILAARNSVLTSIVREGHVTTCPCCGQFVPIEGRDRNYRARVRRWLKKQKA